MTRTKRLYECCQDANASSTTSRENSHAAFAIDDGFPTGRELSIALVHVRFRYYSPG